jgi:hypothetical protein
MHTLKYNSFLLLKSLASNRGIETMRKKITKRSEDGALWRFKKECSAG